VFSLRFSIREGGAEEGLGAEVLVAGGDWGDECLDEESDLSYREGVGLLED
jgi:hypothetical protein